MTPGFALTIAQDQLGQDRRGSEPGNLSAATEREAVSKLSCKAWKEEVPWPLSQQRSQRLFFLKSRGGKLSAQHHWVCHHVSPQGQETWCQVTMVTRHLTQSLWDEDRILLFLEKSNGKEIEDWGFERTLSPYKTGF